MWQWSNPKAYISIRFTLRLHSIRNHSSLEFFEYRPHTILHGQWPYHKHRIVTMQRWRKLLASICLMNENINHFHTHHNYLYLFICKTHSTSHATTHPCPIRCEHFAFSWQLNWIICPFLFSGGSWHICLIEATASQWTTLICAILANSPEDIFFV